jgi:uncharacterized protein YacL
MKKQSMAISVLVGALVVLALNYIAPSAFGGIPILAVVGGFAAGFLIQDGKQGAIAGVAAGIIGMVLGLLITLVQYSAYLSYIGPYMGALIGALIVPIILVAILAGAGGLIGGAAYPALTGNAPSATPQKAAKTSTKQVEEEEPEKAAPKTKKEMDAAAEALRMRYVNGKITRAKYLELKKDLEEE